MLSKKDDVEDTIDDKYSSNYPYGRDSKSKLQPQNLPTKLGETLINIFNIYRQWIILLIFKLKNIVI